MSPDDCLSGPKYVVTGIINTFIRVTSPFLLASTINMTQHYKTESYRYRNMLGDTFILLENLKLEVDKFNVENVIIRGCKWNVAVTENVKLCDY
jgi:hypothetical protein